MSWVLRVLSMSMVFFTLVLSGCASFGHKNQALHQSTEYYNFIQPSFEEYVTQSRRWLQQHRSFVGDDIQKELNMNAPFQLSPEHPTQKAILLVHGLGDSPFTFWDLSRDLVAQGFHVEVLLLPGHGSKPEDLLLPDYQDWRDIVAHYSTLLKQQYREVWLGGFSTGANLVTTHAIEHEDIAGLLLFSPGFQSQTVHLEKLTPLLAGIFDWSWKTEENNLAKYNSSTFNAAQLYVQSAREVRKAIKANGVAIPSVIVMTEADSIIDPDAVKKYFSRHFNHDDSRLLWFGESPQQESNIVTKSMRLPLLRISTASHMSVMFKPCNPYYGISGEKLICENGFDRDERQYCAEGAEVWFSAWGYTEEGKIHARLTWNPYYGDMMELIANVTTQEVKTPQQHLLSAQNMKDNNPLGVVANF